MWITGFKVKIDNAKIKPEEITVDKTKWVNKEKGKENEKWYCKKTGKAWICTDFEYDKKKRYREFKGYVYSKKKPRLTDIEMWVNRYFRWVKRWFIHSYGWYPTIMTVDNGFILSEECYDVDGELFYYTCGWLFDTRGFLSNFGFGEKQERV